MKIPAVTVIDFETKPIQGYRPEYPPVPVGVSIREPGKRKSEYMAWGHPTGNNCTKAQAIARLKTVWTPSKQILFFNGKFDYDVGITHLGMKHMPALNVHDAQFQMFLRDPHSRVLALKPLGERWLGHVPEARNKLQDWIMEHKKELEANHGRFTPSEWGSMIAYAPAGLAGEYACDDTDITFGLFKDSWDDIFKRGMLPAYQREQQVMPIFLENERVGIRIDLARLRMDVELYRKALGAADAWLRKRLKSPSLNIDSDKEFAEALSANGIVADEDWTLTATGQRSVAKKNLLPSMFKDAKVARAFGYRNRLTTCLGMFMEPWLAQGEARGGWISTNWNQVRGAAGGTRTGRPSTNDPNFLNISKSWDANDDGYEHPDHLKLEPLPLVRKYLLPDAGGLWLHRDYNGQELRLLGHFEDGPLMQAYKENPWLDVHQFVADLIEDVTGLKFVRKNVKIANFRIVYGGGAPATAAGVGCSLDEAKQLLEAHGRALPSIKGRGGIQEQIKDLCRAERPIVTWGGREYYPEPPSFNKKYGREMTYEYKLLNYLCQGSAADVTKQALINYNDHPKRGGRFLVTVYDEINSSSPAAKAEKARVAAAKAEMAVLRESMECISEQLDVPMLSEGKWGPTWGDQSKFAEGESAYV